MHRDLGALHHGVAVPVGSVEDQPVGHLGHALECCQMLHRDVVAIQQVGAGLLLYEEFDDGVPPSFHRPEERRVAEDVCVVYVRALLQEELAQAKVPVVGGLVERSAALVVGVGDVRLPVGEHPDHLLVVLPRRLPQRRPQERPLAEVQVALVLRHVVQLVPELLERVPLLPLSPRAQGAVRPQRPLRRGPLRRLLRRRAEAALPF
mmetsp:Transcript_56178/g.164925  ORF Transcript_56178/g.164925 Transcript_56178/m.164925 type:complete len:206 (-) Transcript_56178:364-981(-)